MKSSNGYAKLMNVIDCGRAEFKEVIEELLARQGGFTLDQYSSFLGMQVHLTKEVQRYFFKIAAHPDVLNRPNLRNFALKFGVDEAPHFEIAIKDLEELGQTLCPIPFWVEAWHSYFQSIVETRPFVRLGAACYLENVATTAGPAVEKLLKGTSFLKPKNMRFIAIHKHEAANLDHGNMILTEMSNAELTEQHWCDLAEGAIKGGTLYCQMRDWALKTELRSTLFGQVPRLNVRKAS